MVLNEENHARLSEIKYEGLEKQTIHPQQKLLRLEVPPFWGDTYLQRSLDQVNKAEFLSPICRSYFSYFGGVKDKENHAMSA